MKCWCGEVATISCGLCDKHHWSTHVAWGKEPCMCKESSAQLIEAQRQARQYQARVHELEAQLEALQQELDAERVAGSRESVAVDL